MTPEPSLHPHNAQRAQRLEVHLQRVTGLAQRLGFTGPPGTAMLDFLDDHITKLQAEAQAGRLLRQAAGTLKARSAGPEDTPNGLDLHTGLRLIAEAGTRLAAQQTTIEVLVAQRGGPGPQDREPT